MKYRDILNSKKDIKATIKNYKTSIILGFIAFFSETNTFGGCSTRPSLASSRAKALAKERLAGDVTKETE